MFLEAHFGDVELHMPEETVGDPEQGEDSNEPSLLVSLDDADARINLTSMVCRRCFHMPFLTRFVDRRELTRGSEKTSRNYPGYGRVDCKLSNRVVYVRHPNWK
jgi:hypothetical protein